jgi:hypothetical protein
MDMDKFFELITNNEDIADIPLLYVLRVATEVFEIINSGECRYELEDI